VKKRRRWRCLAATVCLLVTVLSATARAEQSALSDDDSATVEDLYPGLASGALTFAVVAALPKGVLLRAADLEINEQALMDEIAKAPEELRPQLQKNAFFVLEGLAAEKLILRSAGKDGPQGDAKPAGTADREVLRAYFERLLANVQVCEAELKAFYEQNRDMFGGATLEQIRRQLAAHVRDQKRQDVVTEHIRTLGKRMRIEVARHWMEEQAVLSRDNPVDKARGSGKPSLVDFGADGCLPCDMMTPILASLKQEYAGRLNVLFVHVRQEQVLGARYGVRSIPVQVFFDKDGKEVFRHTGFFPQEAIEKKLAEIGVN